MRKIILASASPRRKELLEQAGFCFEIITSNLEEVITKKEPREIVEELSLQKARAVANMIYENAVIIGADTIVVQEGRIMGKPKSEEEAEAMLRNLQGRVHQVYTGVTLIIKNGAGETVRTFSEETDVSMYSMQPEEIRSYVASGEPMDKAGAYGIQGRAAVFIKGISGDYHNVVGLPIAKLYHELKKWIVD